jgi:hypothetical protein
VRDARAGDEAHGELAVVLQVRVRLAGDWRLDGIMRAGKCGELTVALVLAKVGWQYTRC